MKKIIFIAIFLMLGIWGYSQPNWNKVSQGSKTTYTNFLGATKIDSGLIIPSYSSLTTPYFKDTLGNLVRYQDSLYFRTSTGWRNIGRTAASIIPRWQQTLDVTNGKKITEDVPLNFTGHEIMFDSVSTFSIGTSDYETNASAVLDVRSFHKGVLFPRLSNSQRNAISAPAYSLLVFNVDSSKYQYYNGTSWVSLTTGSGGINIDTNRLVYTDKDNIIYGQNEFYGDIYFYKNNTSFSGDNGGGIYFNIVDTNLSYRTITFPKPKGDGSDTVAYRRYVDSVVNSNIPALTLQDVTTNGNTTTDSIIAASFKRTGGTASQFLKANGSVDNNTYLNKADSIAGGYYPYSSNPKAYLTSASLTGYVPYTGATSDVDLGAFALNAASVKINGTNGNGHIHLRHQASDATSTGQSTTIFANSNGDLKWKNDGNYYTTLQTYKNSADRIYNYQNKSYTLADSTTLADSVSALRTAVNTKGSGTVTSVAALTLGTIGTDLSSTVANSTTTPVITLNVPTASGSNRGVLSSADWTTFNGKFTLPSLTSGSVLFSNGTTISQNNSNFFWDNTNSRLGISTTSPQTKLHVVGNSSVGEVARLTNETVGTSLIIENGSTPTVARTAINFRQARGSLSTPSAVQTGDFLGSLLFVGYQDAYYSKLSIDAIVDGTVSSSTIPTALVFSVSSTSAARAETMRLSSAGNLLLGNTTGTDKLTVTGNLNLNTAGNKIKIATGTNASVGVSAAMTAGTITISTTAVTSSSRIFLTHATLGGTQGILSVGTIVNGTSFVINSSSILDTGTVNWLIIN